MSKWLVRLPNGGTGAEKKVPESVPVPSPPRAPPQGQPPRIDSHAEVIQKPCPPEKWHRKRCRRSRRLDEVTGPGKSSSGDASTEAPSVSHGPSDESGSDSCTGTIKRDAVLLRNRNRYCRPIGTCIDDERNLRIIPEARQEAQSHLGAVAAYALQRVLGQANPEHHYLGPEMIHSSVIGQGTTTVMWSCASSSVESTLRSDSYMHSPSESSATIAYPSGVRR